MAATCPGCGHDMREATYDAHYGGQVAIDECHACNGLWFDRRESTQLSPRGLLRLFRSVHERQPLDSARGERGRTPMAAKHACPRCRAALKETWDKVRETSFSYLACPAECGRYSTFVQFLREKQLARDATAKELEALKVRVKVIHCSSCGAPVELHQTTVCVFCRAPVTYLGASLAQTLSELHVPGAGAVQQTQAATAEGLARALAAAPASKRPDAPGVDLVLQGLDALLTVLR